MCRRSCGDPGPEGGGAAYVVVKHRANALLGQQRGHAEDCLRVHRTAQVRERPPDVQLDRLRRQVDGGRWFEFQDQRRCRASLRCGQPVGHECCRTVGRVRAAIAGATSAIAAVKAMSSPSSPICRPPKDRTSTRRTRHDVHPIPRATVHDRPGSGCVAMACRSPGHRRGPISRAGIVLMNVASSTPRSPEERVVLALQRPRPAGDCPHRPSPVKSTARMPPPVVGDVLGGTVVYLLLLFMTRAVLRLIRASAQV